MRTPLPLGHPEPDEDDAGAPSVLPTDAPANGPAIETRDDAELVVRIRLGDERALECLFQAYYEPLCAFAMGYVGSSETAEEVVQDLFLRLWARRADWDVRESVRTYLYGSVRNQALKAVRHDRVVARHEERVIREIGTGRAPSMAPAPDEEASAREVEAAWARAIAQLPERRRRTYTLRWQHHLTLAEIARVMGTTAKGVELQLARASATIREALAAFRDRK